MRIAIQLYGHLRSFERTAESFFQYVVEPNRRAGIECDIFIHTWDEFDAIQKMPAQYNKDMSFAGLKLSDVVREKALAAYAPTAYLIEAQLPLTERELEVVKANNYNADYCLAFKNTAHTFCSANKVRADYEVKNNFKYDLVIITRPDILFCSPLSLEPFFNKTGCWQFFDEITLNAYVFSAYINGVHAVICPEKYIPGLDLILMATPEACDKLATWEDAFGEMIDVWPENALIVLMNRFGLKHSYFTYEKDKCWTILRLGAVGETALGKFVDRLYKIFQPLLLKSRLYCRHTYTNVTTMPNLEDFKGYLLNHLGISPVGLREKILFKLKFYGRRCIGR